VVGERSVADRLAESQSDDRARAVVLLGARPWLAVDGDAPVRAFSPASSTRSTTRSSSAWRHISPAAPSSLSSTERVDLEHVPDAIRDLDAGRIAGKAAVIRSA
jgi:hypothetical protein